MVTADGVLAVVVQIQVGEELHYERRLLMEMKLNDAGRMEMDMTQEEYKQKEQTNMIQVTRSPHKKP